MDNEFNDEELIIRNKNSSNQTINFFFVISILLFIIAIIYFDTNIYVIYDIIDDNNIPSIYKYIFIIDILYSLWYLIMYMYIICNIHYKFIKIISYVIISIMYIFNYTFHIYIYFKMDNALIKKNKFNDFNKDLLDSFIFFSLIFGFNCIMSYIFLNNLLKK